MQRCALQDLAVVSCESAKWVPRWAVLPQEHLGMQSPLWPDPAGGVSQLWPHLQLEESNYSVLAEAITEPRRGLF